MKTDNRLNYLTFALVAIGGYFLAGVAGTIFGVVIDRFDGDALSESAATRKSGAKSALHLEGRDDVIFEKNMFSFAARGAAPRRMVSGGADLPEGLLAGAAVADPATLGVSLAGTVIAGWDDFSAAILEDTTSHEQEIYPLHTIVKGDMELVRIEPFRVYFRRGGRLMALELDVLSGGEGKAAGGLAKPIKSASAAPSGKGAVRSMGGSKFVVDKQFLDNELKNMNRLLTEIRAVPEVGPGGETVGFKVFQIVGGSIYEKIGLENNDVIRKINGIPLDSAEKGLDMYQSLKSEKSFSVEVTRGGSPVTLSYMVQ